MICPLRFMLLFLMERRGQRLQTGDYQLVTVMMQVVLTPPIVTVIVADPALRAVTSPVDDTEATAVEDVEYDGVVAVASAGLTVGRIW